MIRRHVFTVIALLCLSTSPAIASDKSDAAEKLVGEIYTPQLNEQLVQNMVATIVRAQPQLGDYRDVLVEFSRKYLDHQEMSAFMVELYAEAFTVDEIRQIHDFYRTDVGKKTQRLVPKIMNRAMQWNMQRLREHQDELRRMLQEAQQARSAE